MTFKESLKNFFKRIWFLLWKDETWKGWLFSIVFLFLFIKFIFFPGLSLITGTALPLAIVESCSMYHDGGVIPFTDYESWWNKHENKYSEFSLEKENFSDFKMHNGFNKGDILFITGANPKKLKVGDIIIFQAPTTNPVIHRIISIETNSEGKRIFSTIGDNNNGQLPFEKEIPQNAIVGKAVLKVAPYVGWAKLIFFELRKSEGERGFCNSN